MAEHWATRGISALLGSVKGPLNTGTMYDFYTGVWDLLYTQKKVAAPNHSDDPVEASIWLVHELGRRAREQDEEALAKLVLINAAASLQLQGVAVQLPDHLRKFTERSNAWIGVVSGMPTIDSSVKETLDKIGLGGGSAKQKVKRSDFRSRPTGFAFLLFTYMTLVRFGFLTNQDILWQAACVQLPPLSKDTVSAWWKVGRLELERSCPELHIKLSEGRAQGNELLKDRALQRVEQAFYKMWRLFSFTSVFSLASGLMKGFKQTPA